MAHRLSRSRRWSATPTAAIARSRTARAAEPGGATFRRKRDMIAALGVSERLSKDGYRGLRLFRPWVEAHPGKDFGGWIRLVAVNLARGHVSSQLGVAE